MTVTSKTCAQTTFGDIPNAISSPGLADGLLQSDGQDLKMHGESGRDHARANRLALQDQCKAHKTSGTCGQSFAGLSASARLQLCLESKLRDRLGENGSLEFDLIWKRWDMPSGPPICALQASARRTGDNGCIGLLTEQSHSCLAAWATPNTMDGLVINPETRRKAPGWSKGGCSNLKDQIVDILQDGSHTKLFASKTANAGVLNPELPRWLMGFPKEWSLCGVTAIRLYHNLRRSLSKRGRKRLRT